MCFLLLICFVGQIPAEDGDEAEPRMRVRLVVPNSACGSIIGKGGSIIKYENFLYILLTIYI